MIQVYGYWNGWTSFAKVGKHLVKELHAQSLLGAVFPLNTLDPPDIDVCWPYQLKPTANVGVFIGYPPASTKWLRGHEFRVLMTVCETDKVPSSWVDECNTASLVVVPSAYSAWVFRNCGVKVPIMTVGHGVDRGPCEPPPRKRDRWRLLHTTAAISFPRRKGTPQLLQAIKEFEPQIDLWIKTVPYSGADRVAAHLKSAGRKVRIVTKHLGPNAWAEFLGRFHATIQPSQGEAFGMVPLEGRCLGVPAILTPYHGHQAHYTSECDIPIKATKTAPFVTQGNDVGSGPVVEPDAIRDAILEFLRDPVGHQEHTRKWAEANYMLWSWHAQMRPLVAQIQEWEKTNQHILPLETGFFA